VPKALHDRLAREAAKKGLTGERRNAYVYGTMAKIDKLRKSQHNPGN
jgi:hypothetical protein